jgi:membrane associated rhomboid family serine protease
MIIPWGSDAPLYHRPIATIGLIVVSVASFLVFPVGQYQLWALVVGDGLHPLQWLTNIFMHAGWGHLIGNMIFLWTFGMVVEGKLGWWAFLLVYVGLGVGESAGMQLLVPAGAPVRMVGASGIILGLLAMCLIWAPRNEVLCIVWFRFTPTVFELSILWFVAFYVLLDVMTAGLSGVLMTNKLLHSNVALVALALAHSLGAVLGFVLAVVLLRLDLVDCENWDVFAVLQGRQGTSRQQARKSRMTRRPVSVEFDRPAGPKKKRPAKGAAARVKSVEDPAAAALRTMRLHRELGEVEAALAVFNKSIRVFTNWGLQESDWLDLAQGLLDENRWGDAASVMLQYVRRTAQPAPRVRLKLGQVLLEKLARPQQALNVLGEIPAGALPKRLEPLRSKLVQQAEHMREEGDLELQDELW